MMNPARYSEHERNLSGVARRVFEATPITDGWTVSQITTELGRGGSRIDVRIVSGCLNSMRDQGLVKEAAGGLWTRIAPRVVQAPALRVVEPEHTTTTYRSGNSMKTTQQKTEPEQAEPLVSIGTLAHRLRATGKALIEWADELEAVGLAFEERVEKANQDGVRLRQLQALLKGLSD